MSEEKRADPISPTTLLAAPQPLAEPSILGRIVSHEVANLIQSIYATVGMLLPYFIHLSTQAKSSNLPPNIYDLSQVSREIPEYQILQNLKFRAEQCRQILDAVVDLSAPLRLTPILVDLDWLTRESLVLLTPSFPNIRFQYLNESGQKLTAQADIWRLKQVFILLCSFAGHSAQEQVQIRLSLSLPESDSAQPNRTEWISWSLYHDGAGPSPALLSWLSNPFTTPYQAQGGVGLALARGVLESNGGTVRVEAIPTGGTNIQLLFPTTQLNIRSGLTS